jgi:hypothetical protein
MNHHLTPLASTSGFIIGLAGGVLDFVWDQFIVERHAADDDGEHHSSPSERGAGTWAVRAGHNRDHQFSDVNHACRKWALEASLRIDGSLWDDDVPGWRRDGRRPCLHDEHVTLWICHACHRSADDCKRFNHAENSHEGVRRARAIEI